MCGIHASVSTTGFKAPTDELKHLLCNRGPDHLGEAKAQIRADDGAPYYVSCTSTVLALRGGEVTAQPFEDSTSGCILCWNGEAWMIDYDYDSVAGNDGKFIFELLLNAATSNVLVSDSNNAILRILRSISGPFAFVFLDNVHGCLYFGRDCLGRRSLLAHEEADLSSMEFSSCADPLISDWKEVEANGIYQLWLKTRVEHGHENTSDISALDQPLFTCQRHTWDILYDADNTYTKVCNIGRLQLISLARLTKSHSIQS
jgi:asparagine synthetase B (glutamine-hydrolysing)